MDTYPVFFTILLFLANFLTIQADKVKYSGSSYPNVGQPWSITCEGLTKGENVEWTRNGASLEPELNSNEFRVSTNETQSTISADVTKKSHQGEYKCISNSEGHYLRVNELAPQPTDLTTTAPASGNLVVGLPTNTSVVEGETLKLVCLVRASLDPKITWEIGNQNYSSSKDRVYITRDAEQKIDNAVLTIKNVTQSDAGRISCRVTLNNIVGGTQKIQVFSTQLTVSSKTDSPESSPVGSGSKLHHSTDILCLLLFLVNCRILFSV